MGERWLRIVDRLQFEAKNAFSTISSCVCQPSTNIKVNGRTCQSSCLLGCFVRYLAVLELIQTLSSQNS